MIQSSEIKEKLIEQQREKISKLQEELAQSKKMQEKLNRQNRTRQNFGASSMGSQSPPPLPGAKVINKWAETRNYYEPIYKTPNKTSQKKDEEGNPKFLHVGTRVYVLERQGGWEKIQTEDGVVSWVYKAAYNWIK